MARFDVGLETQPTTTVGRAPAVVDTSALAVAQLAEAFAGQYFSEQAELKKQEKKDAASALVAGLQTDILKLGQSVESGEKTLSQGNVLARQLTIETITANPSLSSELSKVYVDSAKAAGLTAGKSEAQLRQEQFLENRKALSDGGWVASDAGEVEVNSQLKAFQKYRGAVRDLEDSQRMLRYTMSREELDTNRKRAISDQAKENARMSIRQIVNSQAARVRALASRWNKELTDGNRQDIFEQADALRREVLAGIPPRDQLFLSDEEVDAMVGVMLQPLDTLKERAEKNMTAKWAQDRIDTTVKLATEDALQNTGIKKLHVWSSLVGETTLSRLATNTVYANYMGTLLDGKGGAGTTNVPKSISKEVISSIIDGANAKPLTSEDAQSINQGTENAVNGVLKDLITDDAQGRIVKPADVENGMRLLSDPAVSKKIISGEIKLDANTQNKARRIVQEEYINKLIPTTRAVLSEPAPSGIAAIEGKAMGNLVNLTSKNGVLSFEIKPEVIEEHAKLLKKEIPGVDIEQHRRAAERTFNSFSKIKDMKSLVTNINRAANVMSTLNRSSNTSESLDQLVGGLLNTGSSEPEQKVETNEKTKELIDGLPAQSRESFNSLPEETQMEILKMSPEQIQKVVSLLAPE